MRNQRRKAIGRGCAPGIFVREATFRDNNSLLELSRCSPMESSLSLYVDRSPDYFYLPRLQGTGSKVYVVEKNGEIVATAGFSFRTVRLFDRQIRIAYVGGLKLRESGRGSSALYRLIKKIYEELLSSDAEMGIVFTLRKNQRALSLLSGRLNFPRFYPLATFKIFHIFPLLPLWKIRRPVEKASLSDLPEIAELFSRFFRKYQLMKDFSIEDIKNILMESQNFSIENFFIVKSKGKTAAVLSWWNQENFKKTVVRRYAGFYKSLYYLFKPLNLLPPEGEPLKVLEIRHIAYEEGHLDAVSDLLKFTFRRFWPEFKIFRIGLHEKDPLIKVLKRLPRVGVDLLLLAAFRKEDPELVKKLQHSLLWEDMTLH